VHFNVYWDHTWVSGTRFEEIRHLILYDFGIHWFDMSRCLMGQQEPQSVFAVTRRAPGQSLRPPLLAQSIIDFPNGQGSISFGGFTRVEAGPIDTTLIIGELATGRAEGPSLLQQRVSIQHGNSIYEPKLSGCWFPDGFQGTMVELLQSIEDKRPCMISAEDNLKSLALCFAALRSADSAIPVRVGSVRTLKKPHYL
jgi:predicted dehydrogenase